MSTSTISIPSRASCLFRFRQKPHQGVVYIVSWPDTRGLLEFALTGPVRCNTAGAFALPGPAMRQDGAVTDAMTGTSEALLAGLDPEQRETALAGRGPVCV